MQNECDSVLLAGSGFNRPWSGNWEYSVPRDMESSECTFPHLKTTVIWSRNFVAEQSRMFCRKEIDVLRAGPLKEMSTYSDVWWNYGYDKPFTISTHMLKPEPRFVGESESRRGCARI